MNDLFLIQPWWCNIWLLRNILIAMLFDPEQDSSKSYHLQIPSTPYIWCIPSKPKSSLSWPLGWPVTSKNPAHDSPTLIKPGIIPKQAKAMKSWVAHLVSASVPSAYNWPEEWGSRRYCFLTSHHTQEHSKRGSNWLDAHFPRFKSCLCFWFQLPTHVPPGGSSDDSGSWVPTISMEMQIESQEPGLGQGSGSTLATGSIWGVVQHMGALCLCLSPSASLIHEIRKEKSAIQWRETARKKERNGGWREDERR